MKVIFVGSLDSESPNIETIITNFKSLVKTLARNNTEFVIRSSNKEGNRIPIDVEVYEALKELNQEGQKCHLMVFKEPGAPSNLKVDIPHTSHSATTSFRIEFYKELLELVDISIGIGGEHGLLRFSMICELMKKPFFLLPGANGTADFLWDEFFKKSIQMIYFEDKYIKQLKQTPFINELDPTYPDQLNSLIRLVKETVEYGVSSSEKRIFSPDNITIEAAILSCRKFTIGLWIVILSGISAVAYLTIFVYNLYLANFRLK